MVPNSFTLNTLLGEELEKARQSFWRSLVGKVYHFKVEMHSCMVISLPLSSVSNCWHERQGFRKMMNQICLLFLFVNYSLEEKRKRNKESHSQFHSRYFSNPNISMHILLTVLCTFLMVLVTRIILLNKLGFISIFLMTFMFDWAVSL